MNNLENGKGIRRIADLTELHNKRKRERIKGFHERALLDAAGVELDPVPIENTDQEQPEPQVEPGNNNMEPEEA